MSEEEPIRLEDYNSGWISKFAAEKELLQNTLGSRVSGGIEHVGSTAVPALIAKPIIDIMVGVEELEKARECIPLLEKIGYLYAPYKTDRMHWFCKPSLQRREFHLYLIEPSHPEWKARIAFRNYLSSHPETAAEYAALKKELAAKFEHDREAYTDGKSNFIKSIVEKALG